MPFLEHNLHAYRLDIAELLFERQKYERYADDMRYWNIRAVHGVGGKVSMSEGYSKDS